MLIALTWSANFELIHSLKQSPRQRHKRFGTVVLSNAFKIHEYDICVYPQFQGNKGAIRSTYVDDIYFWLKVIGVVDVILGIKIPQKENWLVVKLY